MKTRNVLFIIKFTVIVALFAGLSYSATTIDSILNTLYNSDYVCNGIVTSGNFEISNSAYIAGDASAGGTISILNQAFISGDVLENQNNSFPTLDLSQTHYIDLGPIINAGTEAFMLYPGVYKTSILNLNQSNIVYVHPSATRDNPVILIVDGPIEFHNNILVNANTADPNRLIIIGTENCTRIEFWNKCYVYARFYAPYATMMNKNPSYLTGSSVVKEATINNTSYIHAKSEGNIYCYPGSIPDPLDTIPPIDTTQPPPIDTIIIDTIPDIPPDTTDTTDTVPPPPPPPPPPPKNYNLEINIPDTLIAGEPTTIVFTWKDAETGEVYLEYTSYDTNSWAIDPEVDLDFTPPVVTSSGDTIDIETTPDFTMVPQIYRQGVDSVDVIFYQAGTHDLIIWNPLENNYDTVQVNVGAGDPYDIEIIDEHGNILPDTVAFAESDNDTVTLSVAVVDRYGNQLYRTNVQWTSDGPAVNLPDSAVGGVITFQPRNPGNTSDIHVELTDNPTFADDLHIIISKTITIDTAYIYDEDGSGYLDAIEVTFSSFIQFPTGTDWITISDGLEIEGVEVLASGTRLKINLKQHTSGPMETGLVPDTIKFDSATISRDGRYEFASYTPEVKLDRAPPVPERAKLSTSNNCYNNLKQLVVIFSESINWEETTPAPMAVHVSEQITLLDASSNPKPAPWTDFNLKDVDNDGNRTLTITFEDTTILMGKRIQETDRIGITTQPKAVIKDYAKPDPNYANLLGRSVPIEVDNSQSDFACDLNTGENPINRETAVVTPIKLRLIEDAEIKFAIYDLLGNLVIRTSLVAVRKEGAFQREVILACLSQLPLNPERNLNYSCESCCDDS
jgi:hypothetical protein